MSAVAQQVLGYLFQEIPSLASHQSFLSSSAPTSVPQFSSAHSVYAAGSVPVQQPAPAVPLQPAPAVPLQQPASVYQPLPRQAEPHYTATQHHQTNPFIGVPPVLPHGDHQRLAALQSQQLQAQALFQTQVSPQEQEAQVNHSNSVSLDSLLSATIKHKQYYAIDFAKLSPFPYISNLKSSNLNLALYSYGSIKHLLYLSNGTLAPVNKAEYNSRLQHILNVIETAF